MSDTDDTDILLIIPPNFFLVHSSGSDDSLLESSRTVVHKPPSCTSQVLEKLVNQVHYLENRLENLELSTASDTVSNRETGIFAHQTWDSALSHDNYSLDSKCYTFPRRRKRKISLKRGKRRELSLTSIESTSTYGKDIPPLPLKEKAFDKISDITIVENINDTQSMDGDISSIVSTPSKKNDKLLLHEIDEFLNKVEEYESPERKLNTTDTSLNSEHVIRATGDYFTQKLDTNTVTEDIKLPSGRTVPSSILDKYIYLVKNNTENNAQNNKANSNIVETENNQNQSTIDTMNTRLSDGTLKTNQNTTKPSIDPKSPSIRRLNFLDVNKDVQPTSTPKRQVQSTKTYMDTFRPSSNKIYDRASKVLEQYRANYTKVDSTVDTNLLHSPKREDLKIPQSKSYIPDNKAHIDNYKCTQKYIDSIDTDLLSLSDLWGPKIDKMESGKLEEERLKREHCEAMIQDLQKKMLEQQEKLAVALKVDRAKDQAISKLREAWTKVTNSLEKAETRHKIMIDKITSEMDQHKMAACDAQKKTQHFEEELYKALDLAHDYQDKCKQLAKDNERLQENMEKVSSMKDEVIKSKDAEIESLRDNYNTVLRLNKQSTEYVKNLESNLEKESIEHQNTRSKLIEFNRKTELIQEETTLLIQEKNVLKDKINEERSRNSMLEKQLAEKQNLLSAMQKREDTMDNEILSLRKQLEQQKNELKCHYQRQLEEAVLAKLQEFQLQLDRAEKELENDARTKEHAIVDTYNKQIGRIEEQHKLEISLLEEKHKEEMKLYRLQLAQSSEKISLLEGKLDSYRHRRGELASQLHAVMQTQWRQALHILTSTSANNNSADLTAASSPVGQDYAPPKIPPMSMGFPRSSGQGGSGQGSGPEEKRPHGRGFNFSGLSDNELQQYVKLLLTKPPMDSSGEKNVFSVSKEIDETPTSDRAEHSRSEPTKEKARKSLNPHKPPWKA